MIGLSLRRPGCACGCGPFVAHEFEVEEGDGWMSDAIDYAARVPVYELGPDGQAVEVASGKFSDAVGVAVEKWSEEQRQRLMIGFPGRERTLLGFNDIAQIYRRPDFPRG